MATAVTQLASCDGFTVDAPAGCLGLVEETWLDDESRPGALAVRTPDGRRGLLLARDVLGVDLDTEQVIASADAALLALDPPRLAAENGAIAATWRASGGELSPRPAAVRAPSTHPPALLRLAAFGLGGLATFVGILVGIDYLITYLISGRPY